MTKPKQPTIKDSIAARANRQAVANFDQLGLTDDELIRELERRGYWGYLFFEKADVDIIDRKIEVSRVDRQGGK